MLQYFTRKTYFSLGTALIVLVFLNYLGWLNPLKNIFHGLFIPFFSKTNEFSVKMGDNYAFFKNQEDFFSVYRECEQKQQDVSVIQAKIQILEQENKELKEVVAFKEANENISTVIARVIGKNTDSTQKSIIIDQGMESNIKIDQPVIVGNGILIGKIIKVEKNIAIIRLTNDNQSKFAGLVLNTNQSPGIVEGGYGLSVKMKFIPRNEPVVVGEQVITSGLESNIPRGLLVGTIAAVENETYQPFQEAVISPTTDLSKLFLVTVLLTV
jgi:rod shape-determining protein MreC